MNAPRNPVLGAALCAAILLLPSCAPKETLMSWRETRLMRRSSYDDPI